LATCVKMCCNAGSFISCPREQIFCQFLLLASNLKEWL
jgi:hypothetical protein